MNICPDTATGHLKRDVAAVADAASDKSGLPDLGVARQQTVKQAPILGSLTRGSVVEPEVFVAIAVVDAVDHDGEPLHLRVPASRATGVKDDRPGAVHSQ